VPLLAFGLAAMVRHRPLAAAAWLAPLVLVKEDLGLTVAVLGGVMVWQARQARRAGRELGQHDLPAAAGAGRSAFAVRARRVGWALVAGGIGATLLATQVLLPALNPEGQWDYEERASATGLLAGLVSDPLNTLVELLGPGEKMVTLLLVVGAAGVIGVRSPIFLAVIPTLAWRFAGDVPFYWTWLWHYDAVLMPIATAALLDALTPRRPPDPAAVPLATRAVGGLRRRRLTAAAIAAALVAVVLPAGQLPVAGLFYPATWQASPRADAAAEIIDAVPVGADTVSDLSLLAYLVPRAEVRWIGTAGAEPPDFVVRNRDSADWGPEQNVTTWASEQFPGADYELVVARDGYELAKRVG